MTNLCRWEYVWCVSLLLSYIGLSSIRSNQVLNMQKYMIGVVVFGFVPVFYCIIHYMSDVIEYMKLEDKRDLEDAENILVWQVSSLMAIAQGQCHSTVAYF